MRTSRQSANLRAEGSAQNAKSGSGGGLHLPQMPNISWERNAKGGVEAWYCPLGATKRSEKTYLVYIGKRKLAQIVDEEHIRQIVLAKLREKGVQPLA